MQGRQHEWNSTVQSDLAFPDPSPSGRKSLVTNLQHMQCLQTVCVFKYPVPSPIRIFCGKRMCAAKRGLTVLLVAKELGSQPPSPDRSYFHVPESTARAPHHLVLSWSYCGGGLLPVGHTTRTLYTYCTLCRQSVPSSGHELHTKTCLV